MATIIRCTDLIPVLPANGPDNDCTLTPLNITIGTNKLTCIVGPCDSGKTAYLRTIAGIDPPAAGKLQILDKDIWALNKQDWQALRRCAGFVLPNSALVSHLSAQRNVALPALYHNLGSVEQIEARASEILNWLGCTSDCQQLPAFLPEYQQRLVAIARCLILEPHILFIDEAFAFLDAATRQKITECYLHMQKELNITLVMSTHDLEFARQHADVLLFTHPDGLRHYKNWETAMNDDDAYVQAYIQNSLANTAYAAGLSTNLNSH